jgi:4-hydroxy-tetrahydrodipicolinate reductase
VIAVGVVGATGRMGREVCRSILDDPDLELAAAVGRSAAGRPLAEIVGAPDTSVVVADRLEALTTADVDVAVDFTGAAHAREHVAWCIGAGIHVVVGTTGFERDPAWGEQDRVGVFIAPNFAIGAVLMQRFAEQAARHMPAVEIIELHHAGKADAPSGTAIATAERIAAARGDAPPSAVPAAAHTDARGVDVAGTPVHAVRLPGLMAHQEVILGGQGQTLTIRHDSIDRTSFMPGVLLAIKAVSSRPGLTVGLDALLDG